MLFVFCLVSLFTFNFVDFGTIFIGFLGGALLGVFMINKAMFLLSGNTDIVLLNDYLLGFIKLVYLDFGFVLLILSLVMLSMIEIFTEQDTPP